MSFLSHFKSRCSALLKRQRILGVVKEGTYFRCAQVRVCLKGIEIESLTCKKKLTDSDEPYRKRKSVVTAIEGKELLIRRLHSPLRKKRALDKTFPFQLEAMIPYSLEDVIVKPFYTIGEGGTDALFVIVAKSYLKSHLKQWKAIDQECVSAVPIALYRFSRFVCPTLSSYLVAHLGKRETELICVAKGRIERSATLSLGTAPLLEAYLADHPLQKEEEKHISAFDLRQIDQERYPKLSELTKKWEKEIDRAQSFFSQKGTGEKFDKLLLVGEVDTPFEIEKWLFSSSSLSLSPLQILNYREYDAKALKRYAIPIGLCLDSAKRDRLSVQFRQGEFAAPRLLRCVRRSFLQSAFLCLCLMGVCLLFSHFSIQKKKRAIHSKLDDYAAYYSDRLDGLTKRSEKEALVERIERISTLLRCYQKSDKAFTPPPRVTTLLRYLSTHPMLNREEEEQKITLCEIEYQLAPSHRSNEAKGEYQSNVRLIFNSPRADWAREFHDALVEDEEMIDGQERVEWNRKGDRYEIAFYLRK